MWKRVSKEAAAEIVKEVAKHVVQWAIPPAIGVMGWLQNVPWFYVTVGVILSGAGIMTWFVQLDEWRSRNRVEHKLVFGNMRIHLTKAQNRVAAVRFGFVVVNRASFPIKFRIDSINTSVKFKNIDELEYPPNKPYQKDVFTVSPGGIGYFDDYDIIVPDNSDGGSIAEFHCEVSYGKSGRFDYKLEINKNTFIEFNGPKISGGEHWYDQ